jgi:hypothetical protein
VCRKGAWSRKGADAWAIYKLQRHSILVPVSLRNRDANTRLFDTTDRIKPEWSYQPEVRKRVILSATVNAVDHRIEH